MNEPKEMNDETFKEYRLCFKAFLICTPRTYSEDLGIDELVYTSDQDSININYNKMYYEILREQAIDILNFQKELVPFISYMDEEDIRIFSMISDTKTLSIIARISKSSYFSSLDQFTINRKHLEKKPNQIDQFIKDFKMIINIHREFRKSAKYNTRSVFPYKPLSRKKKYRESVLLGCKQSTSYHS